jgi:hypothetical protein
MLVFMRFYFFENSIHPMSFRNLLLFFINSLLYHKKFYVPTYLLKIKH